MLDGTLGIPGDFPVKGCTWLNLKSGLLASLDLGPAQFLSRRNSGSPRSAHSTIPGSLGSRFSFLCIVFGPAPCLSCPNRGFVLRTHGAFAGCGRRYRFRCLDCLDRCRGFYWGGGCASEEGCEFSFQGRDFFFEIGSLT